MQKDSPTKGEPRSSTAILLSGSAVVTVSVFLMVLAQFVVMLLISHRLGDYGMGVVSLALRTVSFPIALASLGLPAIVTRFAASDTTHNPYSSLLIASVLPSLFVSLASFAVIGYLSESIAVQIDDPNFSFLLTLEALTIPLTSVGTLSISFVRGRMQFGKYSALLLINPIVYLAFVVFWFSVLTTFLVILATVIASAAAMLTSITLTSRVAWKRPSRSLTVDLLRAGFPLLLAGFAGSLIDSTGIVVLGLSTTDLGLVGSYANAFAVSSYLRYLVEPLAVVLLPVAAAALASSAKSDVESAVAVTMRIVMVVFVPVSFVLSVLSAELLVILFPIEFVVGAPALAVLAISSPAIAIYYVFWRLLIANSSTYTAGGLLTLFAITNVLLTIVLISFLGMIGAALSTAITFSMMAAGMVLITKRKLGIGTQIRNRDVLNALAFLTLLVLWHELLLVVLQQVGLHSHYLVAVLVIGAAILLQVIRKPLSQAERNFILEVAGRRSTHSFVSLLRLLLTPFTAKSREGRVQLEMD